MTAATWRKFNGEIPRLPTDRLPEDAAQTAINCDFAHSDCVLARKLARVC